MMTLRQLEERFPDEDSCKQYLVERRWPEGVRCPRCESEKVRPVSKRPFSWQCRQCNKNGYRFSVTAGTIFENTKYPLRTWFQVIYLMLQSKKGISALQIHRMIGTGSYETAWYMCHRIRAAMVDGGFKKLSGVVEIDETYVGGKSRNRHPGNRGKGVGYGKPTKRTVIGAIERKGNVTARVINKMSDKTVTKFVEETVSTTVSMVATDQHALYEHRAWGPGRPHEAVTHNRGQYVRPSVYGSVHTANIDSFWSMLKRGVVGTYHKIGKGYLPLYLNEFSFRHNNRKNPDAFAAVVAAC